jgi:sodium/hydrogen antiporter
VLNPVVPVRVRRILNVESGLNDGLATPVVLFSVAAATGLAGDPAGHGVLEAVLELVIGAVVGALTGVGAGMLIGRSRDRGWADRGLLPLATLAVPLLCYYGAVELGGNGFIAAFVAGTAAAASQARVHDFHDSMALTGLTATFLSYAVWMLFGVITVTHLASLFSWQNLVFAVLSLTVVRMLPVALSLLGTGLNFRTVVFVGWFGPRGLASIIFALIALESLHEDPAVITVLTVIATTVVLSVIAHGVSSTPWAQRYGAWVNRTHPTVESAESAEPLHRHGSPVNRRDHRTEREAG